MYLNIHDFDEYLSSVEYLLNIERVSDYCLALNPMCCMSCIVILLLVAFALLVFCADYFNSCLF